MSIQHAVDLFASEGFIPGLAFANVSVGIAHQSSGQLNEAVKYFKTAVGQKERFDAIGRCLRRMRGHCTPPPVLL